MILGRLFTSKEFDERWQNTDIIIKDENDKKIFELRFNTFLELDDFGFINVDAEFTDEIYKYEVLSVEFLKHETIIKVKEVKK